MAAPRIRKVRIVRQAASAADAQEDRMPILTLRGGRVVDPAQAIDGRFDVTIEDGRVTQYRARVNISFKYEAN